MNRAPGPDKGRGRGTAFVGIAAEPKAARWLTDRLSALPELRQLSSVSGEVDCIAVLRAETLAGLDALLDEIGAFERGAEDDRLGGAGAAHRPRKAGSARPAMSTAPPSVIPSAVPSRPS